jgi:hypothetical protein
VLWLTTPYQVYLKKAEQARAAWKEEVAKWVSSLNLAQLLAARSNREPGTRDDAAMSVLPRRPGNAYALFLADISSRQDFREKVDAIVAKEAPKDDREAVKKRISLYGRTAGDIWKSMSDKEKAVSSTRQYHELCLTLCARSTQPRLRKPRNNGIRNSAILLPRKRNKSPQLTLERTGYL